jgi:DNA polymerase-3 subunit delta'
MTELYDDVIGQDRAIAALRAAVGRPVHAYLFIGPPGSGKRAAAVSFAAALLCPTAGSHIDQELCESCGRVVRGTHPDVVQVEREGAFIGMDAAREVIRTAFMSPLEGERKVVVLHDFHLVRDTGPALLKTIEEPPPPTIFVVLAEYLPPELVTIASRCIQVNFAPLTEEQVVAALEAAGVDVPRARELAIAAGGRLDRARLLAADPEFQARRAAWHGVPARLDGTGGTAARVADELVAFLESSVEPLRLRQAAELAEAAERNARASEIVAQGRTAKRASKAALNAGLKDMEDRHRREQRRQRTDELRAGLATLAGAYRERLVGASDTSRRIAAIDAIREIDRVVRTLEYNPGELLLLQALLSRLGQIPANALRKGA